MSYNAKAIIIQSLLIVSSGLLTISLYIFFCSRGLENLFYVCSFIPFTSFGLYIFFGKYVFLHGLNITKRKRLLFGSFYTLLTPVIWLIYYFTGNV